MDKISFLDNGNPLVYLYCLMIFVTLIKRIIIEEYRIIISGSSPITGKILGIIGNTEELDKPNMMFKNKSAPPIKESL
jgi:hypothetical protein